MAVCLYCDAEMLPGRASCPRCGQQPLEASAAKSVKIEALPEDFEVQPIHRADATAPVFDREGGSALELDIAPSSKSYSQHHAPSAGVVEVRLPGDRASAAMAPLARVEKAEVRATSELELAEQRQARELANYGDPPAAIWKTPLYALRVYLRKKELRKTLVEMHAGAEASSRRVDDAYVTFAERARARAEEVAFYARAVAGIKNLEQQVGASDGALAAQMDAHRARLVEIDAHAAKFETALARARDEERRSAEELAQAEATLQRAEARLRRFDLESRGRPRRT